MEDKDLARKFAPEITFSRGERYFPCPVFFAGTRIIDNRKAYDALSDHEKKQLVSCYYHVVEDEEQAAYEYWYYYAYNDYSGGWTGGLPDRHDHDMEFAIVYVNKSSGSPMAIASNRITGSTGRGAQLLNCQSLQKKVATACSDIRDRSTLGKMVALGRK